MTTIQTPTLLVKFSPTKWARVTGPVGYNAICDARDRYLRYNEEHQQELRNVFDDFLFNNGGIKYYWTGNCSEYVYRNGRCYSQKKKSGSRMWTPQHRWPRSVATHLLLTNTPQNLKDYIDICENKYLLHDLTTSRENNDMRPFQKLDNFTSPEIVERESGILIVKAPFS